jgi:hypothetical protein
MCTKCLIPINFEKAAKYVWISQSREKQTGIVKLLVSLTMPAAMGIQTRIVSRRKTRIVEANDKKKIKGKLYQVHCC